MSNLLNRATRTLAAGMVWIDPATAADTALVPSASNAQDVALLATAVKNAAGGN